MNKYYLKLDKNAKRKIKKLYQEKYKNSELEKRLRSLTIYVISGYLMSIFLIVSTIFGNDKSISNYILAGTLLVASTVFLGGRIIIKLNVLNDLALKNK